MDGFFLVAGLLCRSFVAINKGTNKREPFAPLGNESAPSVREGNLLCTRTWVFQKKRRLYIYGSWVVPWTSQELVHIWCISMNYQLFHFSTMVEILHLDLMGKRWTNILKCHSNLTSGMPAALQDMPPFVGRPSYGRIVPVGAAKVIAAAMAAPDAGVHEESPKGSFWENFFFIENKKGRIMV